MVVHEHFFQLFFGHLILIGLKEKNIMKLFTNESELEFFQHGVKGILLKFSKQINKK